MAAAATGRASAREVAALNLGGRVAHVACCPFRSGPRLIAAGGEQLNLVSQGAGAECELVCVHTLEKDTGDVQQLAWGAAAEDSAFVCLASIGPSWLNLYRLGSVGDTLSMSSAALPVHGDQVFASAFLAGRDDQLAIAGDDCRCRVLHLSAMRGAEQMSDADRPPATVSIARSIALSSEGIAVRTHPHFREQLMVAEGGGALQFVDLRSKDTRPSLSRVLPHSRGLSDADWSLHDPFVVGGVSGDDFVAWDLRFQGINPAPQMMGAVQAGAIGFRWAPTAALFAVAGSTGEVTVHDATVAPGDAIVKPTSLSTGISTRVASLSWSHYEEGGLKLIGASDTCVCLWSAPRS